jgi:hypothetical protein
MKAGILYCSFHCCPDHLSTIRIKNKVLKISNVCNGTALSALIREKCSE